MVQQVTEISRSLKNLARELDVPVLALSQLSRAVEQRGGKPRLSDLRDSGSIEQDADVVMFIHRDDKINKDSERPNIAEILIEKHRNGPVGKVELYFDEKRTTFMSLDKTDFRYWPTPSAAFCAIPPHPAGHLPRQPSEDIKKLGADSFQCKECFRWSAKSDHKNGLCSICGNAHREKRYYLCCRKRG
jgi:hypothetical protein